MNATEGEHLALLHMEEHGLFDELWHFDFESCKRSLGRCHYHAKKITLSKWYVELNEEDDVEDTILHEIAHILAGSSNKHNKVWKRWAAKVGAPTRARYSDINHGGDTVCIQKENAKYILINQDTGEIYRKYFRKPKRVGWLGKTCFIKGKHKATIGKLVVKEISL